MPMHAFARRRHLELCHCHLELYGAAAAEASDVPLGRWIICRYASGEVVKVVRADILPQDVIQALMASRIKHKRCI